MLIRDFYIIDETYEADPYLIFKIVMENMGKYFASKMSPF